MIQLLDKKRIKIGAILLCETFLSSSNYNHFDIKGFHLYEIHRKDRRGGGVAIYVNEAYHSRMRSDIGIFEQGQFESVFCELHIGGRRLVVGEVYRPPNSNIKEFTAKFHAINNKLHKINCYKVIGSDQNIDLLTSSGGNASSTQFLDSMVSSHLLPLVTKPTRVTERSGTLIDNIYVSSECYNRFSCKILINDMSDHFPCLAFLQIEDRSVRSSTKFVYRQFPNKCFEKISNDMSNIDWDVDLSPPTDLSYLSFSRLISASFDNHCPLKTVTIKPHKFINKKWMTNDLLLRSKKLQLMFKETCCRDRSSHAYKQYIVLRNELNKDKRHQKRDYYNNLILQYQKNSKKLWSLINEQSNRSSTKPRLPDKFVNNDEHLMTNIKLPICSIITLHLLVTKRP